MDYGELLELIIDGCDNTDCQHCILYNLCVKYEITPLRIKYYLLECEKRIINDL